MVTCVWRHALCCVLSRSTVLVNLKLGKRSTHLWTQCAAVTIHFSLMIEPPHTWRLLYWRDTCEFYGQYQFCGRSSQRTAVKFAIGETSSRLVKRRLIFFLISRGGGRTSGSCFRIGKLVTVISFRDDELYPRSRSIIPPVTARIYRIWEF